MRTNIGTVAVIFVLALTMGCKPGSEYARARQSEIKEFYTLWSETPMVAADHAGTRTYYDQFEGAVVRQWHSISDVFAEQGFVQQHGQVTLQFRLSSDGLITNVKVIQSTTKTVQTLMCEKAVLDPAPYGRWTTTMRDQIGADHQELRFTFVYD